ncbi:hypothetical protein EGK58_014415 [Acinetobacter variabilis]|uniref:Uncharacterized protein n=1 Tax=Acinetobacter variabilis TaxID=70346 RepID=A0A8F6M2S6_9GAMM|nr:MULTISPECIES: hypothetical protein [Acinetobacter]MBD0078071.1 hypothetical protein [Acinetobacter baumannii]MBP4313906.1 hypothetical protein [Acinetobacter baumannii]MBP5036821.1 hypothetical protein [Acinetobacter baumannii]MCA4085558.1 hypothetical protein [Acinetobacter baumannii]QXR19219.1 hypothetical protein EGK58_014415 [Acinetobacter variabilis]
MRKPPISAEKIKIQPEPVVDQPTLPPSAAYVESVRITPERLWNTLLKNYKQQGGPSEH